MICNDCPYKEIYRKYGNSTKEVMCQHPDKEYVRKYYKEHDIRKFEGFIGFINSKGVFPIKGSPKWCPLKQRGGDNDA